MVKNPSANAGDARDSGSIPVSGRSPGRGNCNPHNGNPLAWKIPWMEEPGRLQSMGSLSWARLSNFTFTFHFHALEKKMATPLQCSCLENPRDRGAWWAAVYGVAQSRTRLKGLSSSSSSKYSCLEKLMDSGAWQATYHVVAEEWDRTE